MKTSLSLLVMLVSSAVLFDTHPALAAGAVYNVRVNGAKGDGSTLDTEAIQAVFNKVRKTGGTIVFPAGNYVSGPLTLRGDNVTLQFDEGATLFASTNQALFLKEGSGDWLAARSGSDFNPFLSLKDSTGLTLTGKGTIDGNGFVWWEKAEEARRAKSGTTLPRPNLIVPTRCNNLRITGLTIQNAPKFHLVPTECDGVWIEDVKIFAPERSANTDAIDPSISRNVTVTNCLIDVGDDNIAIKSGKKVEGREFACENITITHCTFKHGHGVSIGSETVGGVKDVFVRHCTFEDTDNGIRIKSDRKRGGAVENLVCEDITMKNVRGAITITSYYPKIPPTDTAQAVTGTTPKYRNITIRNLSGTSSKSVGVIVGLPESGIENVLLENVELSGADGGLEIRNATGVELKNVKVTAAKGPPIIVQDAKVTGLEE
ncbi:MAG: glycoside hydrolase family 28 protein [Verrucomicrobia bacterium]|nr:glycoside hydrolase family 28 protein [Verrucomicrobiota bacterium]